MELIIEKLHAEVDGQEILKGVDLHLRTGEIHALMGPNGSGKSTLANVIFGHPGYRITRGGITLGDRDLLAMETHERALCGLFLAFQYPVEVSGVTVGKFLKRAIELRQEDGKKMNVSAYIQNLRKAMTFLEIDQKFINRYLNEGFSGGEKKKMEMLQMLMLNPVFAVLDETDSGLDVDALKIVSKGINRLRGGPDFGGLIITHYQRILDHVKPDRVHVMLLGKIVKSGGSDLVKTLEQKGYDWINAEFNRKEAA